MYEIRLRSIGAVILAEENQIDLVDSVSFITWYGGSFELAKFSTEFIFMVLRDKSFTNSSECQQCAVRRFLLAL